MYVCMYACADEVCASVGIEIHSFLVARVITLWTTQNNVHVVLMLCQRYYIYTHGINIHPNILGCSEQVYPNFPDHIRKLYCIQQ